MSKRIERALITGGLGFIGSDVAERMLEAGIAVTVIDSRISNVISGSELETRFSQFQLYEEPISAEALSRALSSRPDVVLHFASYVGPASILKYSGTIGSEIVANTRLVVDACQSQAIPLVFLSSAEVYGFSGLLKEQDSIRVPPYYNARIEYALAKLTSESMVTNSVAAGLRAFTIRPFNVAGARQSRKGGFVIPTFVEQALRGEALTVFDTGEQERAFLDVRDMTSFILGTIEQTEVFDGRVVNVGNPDNRISIAELAKKVKDQLNSPSAIAYVNPKTVHGTLYEEAESFRKIPSIERANALGWTPLYDMDEIVAEATRYTQMQIDLQEGDRGLAG